MWIWLKKKTPVSSEGGKWKIGEDRAKKWKMTKKLNRNKPLLKFPGAPSAPSPFGIGVIKEGRGQRGYRRPVRSERTSYITFKFRTSLNIKRILSSFYSPLPLSKVFSPSNSKKINFNPFITENGEIRNYKKQRADIILYKAHWAKSISQAQHFLKNYLTSTPTYLNPGDEIKINPKLLTIIYKNKLLHLKKGNPIPNYLLVNTLKIKYLPLSMEI